MPTLVAELDVTQVERGLARIRQSFDSLEAEARGTGQAVDAAFGDSQGVDDFDEGLQRTSRSSGLVTGALRTLGPIVAGLFSVQTARAAFDYAATFDTIQNRVRSVVPDINQLSTVTGQLADVSRQTGVGFESVAATYQRFSIATQGLGLDQQEVIGLVQTLNAGLGAYGATAEEAATVSLQLGQGFASGALQGDELRAVLEGFPPLTQAIAAELGIASGEVKQFGADGQITAEVLVGAFDRLGESTETLGQNMERTAGAAFEGFKTSLIELVGSIDDSIGVTDLFAQAFDNAATNIANVTDFLFPSLEQQVEDSAARLEELRIATEEGGDGFEFFGIQIGGATAATEAYNQAADEHAALLAEAERGATLAAIAAGELGESVGASLGQFSQSSSAMGTYVDAAARAASETTVLSDSLQQLAQDLARANTAQGLLTGGAGDYREAIGGATEATRELEAAERRRAAEAVAAARAEVRERGELIDFIRRGGIEREREQQAAEEAFRRTTAALDQVAIATRQNIETTNTFAAGIAEAFNVSEGAVRSFAENATQVLNGFGLTTAETFDQLAGNIARAFGLSEGAVGGFFDVANDALDIFGIELEDVFGRRATEVFEQFAGLSDTTIDLVLTGGQRLLDLFGVQFPASAQTAGIATQEMGTTSNQSLGTVSASVQTLVDDFLIFDAGVVQSGAGMSTFGQLGQTIIGTLSTLWTQFTGLSTQQFTGFITTALGLFTNFGGSSGGIIGTLGTLWNQFTGNSTNQFTGFVDIARSVFSNFSGFFQGTVGNLTSRILGFFNQTRSGALNLQSVLGNLGSFASNVFGRISGGINSLLGQLGQGSAAITNFGAGLVGNLASFAIGKTGNQAAITGSQLGGALGTVIGGPFGGAAGTIVGGIGGALSNRLRGKGGKPGSSISNVISQATQGRRGTRNQPKTGETSQEFITRLVKENKRLQSEDSQVRNAGLLSKGATSRSALQSLNFSILSGEGQTLFNAKGKAVALPKSLVDLIGSRRRQARDNRDRVRLPREEIDDFLGFQFGGVFGRGGSVLNDETLLGSADNITPTSRLAIGGEGRRPEGILPLAKTSEGLGVNFVGNAGGQVVNNTRVIVIRDVTRQELDDLFDEIDQLDASIEERIGGGSSSFLQDLA